MTLLSRRLIAAFDLTDDVAAHLDKHGLSARNGTARSNTIGDQMWCLVGARESYARAFASGGWAGFACSLLDPHSPTAVVTALASARHDFLELLDGASEALTEAQQATVLDLLEHEVQHHGQLIRYFYANDLPFPESFAVRYALG